MNLKQLVSDSFAASNAAYQQRTTQEANPLGADRASAWVVVRALVAERPNGEYAPVFKLYEPIGHERASSVTILAPQGARLTIDPVYNNAGATGNYALTTRSETGASSQANVNFNGDVVAAEDKMIAAIVEWAIKHVPEEKQSVFADQLVGLQSKIDKIRAAQGKGAPVAEEPAPQMLALPVAVAAPVQQPAAAP